MIIPEKLNGLRVLIVDDNASARKIFLRTLCNLPMKLRHRQIWKRGCCHSKRKRFDRALWPCFDGLKHAGYDGLDANAELLKRMPV